MSISESIEILRIALMNNYNSQTITHAGYVIALTVGILSIISKWNDLWNYARNKRIKKLFLTAVLSITIGLVIYFLLRVVYWSTLSDLVMNVDISTLKVSDTQTYISELQKTAVDSFQEIALAPNFTSNYLLKYLAFQTHDYNFVILIIISTIVFVILWICFWIISKSKEVDSSKDNDSNEDIKKAIKNKLKFVSQRRYLWSYLLIVLLIVFGLLYLLGKIFDIWVNAYSDLWVNLFASLLVIIGIDRIIRSHKVKDEQ